ncbi:MAG: AAA family ATPase, partial [Betaproteobacteria bacterium]|nr:AAA family ATPase [Betaproteobacteria bacterium]
MIRRAQKEVERMLRIFPAVVLLGARQVGKTTMAEKIASQRASVLFDLENKADRNLLQSDPVSQLCQHDGKLIVLDEVQNMPDIFEAIRVAIDRLNPDVPGKFLLLGSACGPLLRQARENLFGRAAKVELCGLDCLETAEDGNVERLWRRGGFPRSYLAADEEQSMTVRQQMCRPMFVSNLAAADSKISAESLERLLDCLARQQGGIANMQEIAGALEISTTTATRLASMLEQMMLIRRLPAFARVGGQSPVKKPRYYVRDSGLLHSLCNLADIPTADGPLGKLRGASWEGFVIENIMAVMPPLWQASFYRNYNKHEIDLVLQKPGGGLWAIEIKASADVPSIKLAKGNLKAIEQLQPERCFVVHGATQGRSILPNNIQVVPLPAIMNELLAEHALPAQLAAADRKRSASGRLATLLAALRSGQPDAPILRDEFIDCCCGHIENIFATNRGANDAAARHDWLQVRDELVEWLAIECQLDGRAGAQCSPQLAKSAKRLLESVLAMKLTPSLAGRNTGPGGAITLADLCCCDLFVHFVALLLANEKFAAVRELIVHDYMAAGDLRDCLSFYYDPAASSLMYNAGPGPEKLPADDAADELYQHLKSSRLDLLRL